MLSVPLALRKRGELLAPGEEEPIACDKERAGAWLEGGCKRPVNLPLGVCL